MWKTINKVLNKKSKTTDIKELIINDTQLLPMRRI